MKTAIKESEDEILNRVHREALEGIRRLGPKPAGYAPSELGPPTPGAQESLGVGFQVAKGKQKKQSKGYA